VSAHDDVLAAKQRLNERADRWPWLAGVGVGKVDDRIGLIVSVRQGGGDAARQALGRLRLSVPLRIREVGTIRSRPTGSAAPKRLSSTQVDRLRAAAGRRRISE
jgi:hypothetical protein